MDHASSSYCPRSGLPNSFQWISGGLFALVLTLTGAGCGMLKNDPDGCGYEIEHPSGVKNATVVHYAISRRWKNPSTGTLEPTPCFMLNKVKKAFEVWEGSPDIPLQFSYLGTFEETGDFSYRKPVITVDLEGSGSYGVGVMGYGAPLGTLGSDDYEGGTIRLNTSEYEALDFKTIVHEVGHTLGLKHTAHIGSVMSCGTPAWGSYDVLGAGEQDYTDLMAILAPSKVYTISGTVSDSGYSGTATDTSEGSTQTGAYFYVYAVDTEKGVTFSTVSNGSGEFTIHVPKSSVGTHLSGNFRVFAQRDSGGKFGEPVDTVPSWYLSDGVSTNDPYAGTVLTLSSANPDIADLQISMISGSLPTSLFWSASHKLEAKTSTTANIDCLQSFLVPGEACLFYLTYLRTAPASVAAYGSAPDYSFSALSPAQNTAANVAIDMSYDTTVTVASDAVPGDRLVLLTPSSGSYVDAALVGVSVVGGTTHPDDGGYIYPEYEMIDSPSDYTEFDGGFFFE